jgi:hypothetical protein
LIVCHALRRVMPIALKPILENSTNPEGRCAGLVHAAMVIMAGKSTGIRKKSPAGR